MMSWLRMRMYALYIECRSHLVNLTEKSHR